MSIDAAHDEIVRLCNGGSWRMTVPVNEDRDSDMILSNALDALEAERDRAREIAVALEQRLATVERFRQNVARMANTALNPESREWLTAVEDSLRMVLNEEPDQ